MRPPAARSIARPVRGASGMVITFPSLRVMTGVRWPRSTPGCLMSAPVASGTRSPLSASRDTSACPAGGPGGGQDRAGLVAVQGGGVRLVIRPGPSDVRGRGAAGEFSLDGVLAEPGDGAQPPGDGGAGASFGLQVACEGLDADAPDREQGQRADAHQAVNWRRSSVQASPVRPRYPARKPASARRSDSVKAGWMVTRAVAGVVAVIGHLPDRLRPGAEGQPPGPGNRTRDAA